MLMACHETGPRSAASQAETMALSPLQWPGGRGQTLGPTLALPKCPHQQRKASQILAASYRRGLGQAPQALAELLLQLLLMLHLQLPDSHHQPGLELPEGPLLQARELDHQFERLVHLLQQAGWPHGKAAKLASPQNFPARHPKRPL